MATGRTSTQQTFPHLLRPSHRQTPAHPPHLPASLPPPPPPLSPAWPPLMYLRVCVPSPHRGAPPRHTPDLLHRRRRLSSTSHKSHSPAADPWFASEAKSQPSGTEKQDRPGWLNKACLFQSPRRNCYSSQVRGPGGRLWGKWRAGPLSHLPSAGGGVGGATVVRPAACGGGQTSQSVTVCSLGSCLRCSASFRK